MPEKRTSPITVALEPSIVELIKANHDNISVWLHDVAVQALHNEGILTTEMLAQRVADATSKV
jgi:hypothetical protein